MYHTLTQPVPLHEHGHRVDYLLCLKAHSSFEPRACWGAGEGRPRNSGNSGEPSGGGSAGR
jgi:hypothetical protein